MKNRGLQLLAAHIRSFDPAAPTARQRLEASLGEPFARRLVQALLPASSSRARSGTDAHAPESRRIEAGAKRTPGGGGPP
jgi:hypothetical protein